MRRRTGSLIRIAVALIAGAGISALDNFAYGGEISPIVIAGVLFILVGATGLCWGTRAVLAAAIVWAWLPMAHVVKHLFGLPDTIHPNTYASILKLGMFSFVVSSVSFGIGLAFRRTLHVEAIETANRDRRYGINTPAGEDHTSGCAKTGLLKTGACNRYESDGATIWRLWRGGSRFT